MYSIKLALSGTSGVGKSTLAKALAEKYEITYVPEAWDGLFSSLLEFKKENEPRTKKEKLNKFSDLLNDWLQLRRKLATKSEGFVMDRCIFDTFLFAIYEPIFDGAKNSIISLIRDSIEFSKQIDCIIIPPLRYDTLDVKTNETGLVRNNDLYTKILNQSLTIGLIEQHCLSAKIYLKPNQLRLEDMLTSIEQHLYRLGIRLNK